MIKGLKIVVFFIFLVLSLLVFYAYFFEYYSAKTSFDIVKGVIFLIISFSTFKHFNKRWFQWTTVLLSFFMLGGIFGIGWIIAIVLSVVFVISGRNNKKGSK